MDTSPEALGLDTHDTPAPVETKVPSPEDLGLDVDHTSPKALGLETSEEPGAFDKGPKTLTDLQKMDVPQSLELNPQQQTSVFNPSPKDLETLNAIQHINDEQDNLIQGAATAGGVLMTPLTLGARTVAGLADRSLEAVQAGSAQYATNEALKKVGLPAQKNSLSVALDSFVNPELVQQVRKNDGQEGVNAFIRGFHEATPPFFVSNVVQPDLEDAMVDAGMGGLAPFASHLMSFGVDVASDPLMYAAIGQITNEGRLAQLEGGTVSSPTTSDIADSLLNSPYRKTGGELSFADQVASGEKALLQFRTPLSPNSKVLIQGEKLAKVIDNVANTAEMSTLGQYWRTISMRTGLDTADMVNNAYSLEERGATLKLNEMSSSIPNTIPDNIQRAVIDIAEHGEAAPKLLAAKGINLEPEEMQFAADLHKKLLEIDNYTTEYARNVGVNIKEFTPVEDLAEEQRLINEARRSGRNVPDLGVNGTDYTFSAQRGLGRKLDPNAKALLEQAGALEKETSKNAGYLTTPASSLGRSKFSTDSMNAMLGPSVGMDEVFRTDIANVVLENAQEKMRAARNVKYMDAMKSSYGKTSLEWDGAINAAKNAIETPGAQVSAEMKKLASLDKDSLTTVSSKAWDKYYAIKAGSDADPTTLLAQKELLYPKPIAASIENVLSTPPKGRVMATLDFLKSQMSKNILTSPKRWPLHFSEGLMTYLNLDGSPTKLLEEMRQALPYVSRDEVGKAINEAPIFETLFGKSEPSVKVVHTSEAMLSDKELNYPMNAFFDSLHGVSKRGEFQNTMDLLTKQSAEKAGIKGKIGTVLDGLGKVGRLPIELVNDNPLSQSIRDLGAHATDLFKRARVRDLLEQGIPLDEALNRASYEFIDFRPQNKLVWKTSYVQPFIAYNIKNVERTLGLLMQRPGMFNVLNPYQGALRRNIENWAGWSPQQSNLIRSQIGPYTDDAVIAGVFNGADSVSRNPDLVKSLLNQYLGAGLNTGEQASLANGRLLWQRIPTNISAMTEFLNPLKITEMGGFVPKIAYAMAGIDTFTGQKFPYDQTSLGAYDRIYHAVQQINPMNYPKVYDLMGKLFDHVQPQWRDHIQNLGLPPRTMQVFNDIFGSSFAGGKLKLDDEVVKQFSNFKMMGLGSLTQAGIQLYYMQSAMGRELQDAVKRAMSEANNKGLLYRKQLIEQSVIPDLHKKMNDNAKAFNDYNAHLVNLRRMTGSQFPQHDILNIDNSIEQIPAGLDQAQKSVQNGNRGY